MISKFDSCIFVHIPKTGGQSIESVFLERAGHSWEDRESMLLKPNATPAMGPPRLAHLTAMEYTQLGYVSAEEFESLFRFTIVRNPWDRLVSEYRYKQHRFSFKDFVFKYFPKEGEDDYQEFNGIYRHVMPQHRFVYDDSGELLVDFVGRFEHLSEDFASLTQLICGVRLPLPHKNKTSTNGLKEKLKVHVKPSTGQKVRTDSYRVFYDEETKAAVGDFYSRDIAMFNYEF